MWGWTWLALITRICVSLLTRTFFQPDEYFQAIEPAHRAVFGFGQLTWEWVSSQPVRSFFFPSVFAPPFYILKLLHLDNTLAVIWAPKVLTGLIASITDCAVYRLTHLLFGRDCATVALVLSLLSPFNVLALSRSLSNAAETSFTILALCFWPYFASGDFIWKTRKSLALASIACVIRPTNIIIWAALASASCWERPQSFASLFVNAVPIALLALSCMTAIDTWYFGHLTFTPLNFLKTNLSPVSTFYGRNPWHYYITQALPIMCATTLPSAIYSWQRSLRGAYGTGARKLGIAALATVFVYSCAGHKEWRFIHPILPILHALTSKGMVDSYFAHAPPPKKAGNAHMESRSNRGRRPIRLHVRSVHLYLIFATLPLCFYIMRYHGQGQIAVMYHLRDIPASQLRSVGFLMPCHSTPWQAYLHRPELDEGRLWSLGCEPPLEVQDLTAYEDQTAEFYRDPAAYLSQYFPARVSPSFPPSPYPNTVPGQKEGISRRKGWQHEWPSHLVMFDHLLSMKLAVNQPASDGNWNNSRDVTSFRDIIVRLGYNEVWSSGWNGWEGDERRRGEVRLWQFSTESPS